MTVINGRPFVGVLSQRNKSPAERRVCRSAGDDPAWGGGHVHASVSGCSGVYVSKTHEHIVWALAYTFLSFADIHAARFFFRCDGVNPHLAEMPVPVRGWPARPGDAW